jgi:hypothetical protein
VVKNNRHENNEGHQFISIAAKGKNMVTKHYKANYDVRKTELSFSTPATKSSKSESVYKLKYDEGVGKKCQVTPAFV